jgi:hypothetical protein
VSIRILRDALVCDREACRWIICATSSGTPSILSLSGRDTANCRIVFCDPVNAVGTLPMMVLVLVLLLLVFMDELILSMEDGKARWYVEL